MAVGLSPTTLAVAGPVMAEAMGYSWDKDRLEVVKYINKYRNLLFTEYNKFKLFDNVFHCICINNFEGYQGFTLPNDVLGVEAVFSYGVPLKIRSRWREAHNGIGVSGLPRVEAVTMAETFATERDLKKVSKLKIFCEHEEDNDKKVYLEVVDASNKVKRIAFTLIYDGFAVSPVKIRKILSVSLPNLRGSLKLMQEDGYELSDYAPWETVPDYRRMKVATSCSASSVLVQGTQKFQKIYFDHEIVEVGNELIIESAGRYFKLGETTTESKEIQTAELHLAKMSNYLLGEIARHRGNAIQDNSPFKAPRDTIRKALPGYSR